MDRQPQPFGLDRRFSNGAFNAKARGCAGREKRRYGEKRPGSAPCEVRALGWLPRYFRMSEEADCGRTTNENESRRRRGRSTRGWRRRDWNRRPRGRQHVRLGLERRGGEMEHRAGPVIGIERHPSLRRFRGRPVRMRMGMRVLVRMRMFGRSARAVSVVVPVIEVVQERKGVEPEKPAEGCRRSPDPGTSSAPVRHRVCMIRQLLDWKKP